MFSWSFLELLHEALFCNFLGCTAASGPYLVTNMKALILHEQNIDHGNIGYNEQKKHILSHYTGLRSTK